jgi:tRNA(His) guanylyltransferase
VGGRAVTKDSPVSEKRDSLGDRMKGQYENRTRVMLPRRTFTILRADGKAFHTYTRDCEKPNDPQLAEGMDLAAIALCEEAQGSCFAYVQSDEISVLLTDFSSITTEAWFDGNLQKIVSVAASVVTAHFNYFARGKWRGRALFDCRAFTVPDSVEVENYFIWRQQDATRNSIQGLAYAHFSHKRLQNVNTAAMQELLFQEKGINWNDTEPYWKRGRTIIGSENGWTVDRDIPVFTQQREYLSSRITRYGQPEIEED